MAATRRMRQANKFCGCIKKVRKTVRLRPGAGRGPQARESAAIAICTKSILQRKGRTLRKVRCGKKGKRAVLETQKMQG